MPDPKPAPMEKRRQDVLGTMTADLQKVALKLADRQGKQAVSAIAYHYDFGALVAQVKKDEVRYGSRALDQLIEFLNLTEGRKYLAMLEKFATVFTRDEALAQAGTARSDGKSLELMHFLELSKVPKASDRSKWFKIVRAENLSANALQQRLAAELPRAASAGSTRPPSVPNSPVAGLQKLYSQGNKFANYLDALEEQIFPTLGNEKPSDALVETLSESREILQKVAESATLALKEIRKIESQMAVKKASPDASDGPAGGEDVDADADADAPDPDVPDDFEELEEAPPPDVKKARRR